MLTSFIRFYSKVFDVSCWSDCLSNKTLAPLATLIDQGFGIAGVVPNNEAVTSVAQKILECWLMSILILLVLVLNILLHVSRDSNISF